MLRKRVVVEERRPLQKRESWWYYTCSAFQITRRCIVLQISLHVCLRWCERDIRPKAASRLVPLVFTVLHSHHPFRRHKAFCISRCSLSLSLSLLLVRRLLSSSFVVVRKTRGLIPRLLHLRLGFRRLSTHVS